MKLHLPTYIEGGDEVELETDNVSFNEMIVGWVDEYGTITSCVANVRIGDLVAVKDREISALIIDVDEFKKTLLGRTDQ